MWSKTLKSFLAVALAALALSCSTNGGKTGGDGGGKTDGGEVSVAFLKSLYNGHPRTVTENYIIEGWVTGSDRTGNFHKTLVVEDATGGIEIKLDMTEIYKLYEAGHIVKVYCNSLTLGAYGGLVQLGSAPSGGYETGHIAVKDLAKHIVAMGETVASLRPAVLEIDRLSAAHLSRFVAFSGVSFAEADGAAQWCDTEWDEEKEKFVLIDTDRVLKDAAGNEIIVRTSSYADFAAWKLPQGRLYVAGILSWFNGRYQLRIIDPAGHIAELD